MQDGAEASYDGEYGGETFTVQVFAAAGVAPRGERQVLLRIRFRGITEDFVGLSHAPSQSCTSVRRPAA
jgi:hypothetical protein